MVMNELDEQAIFEVARKIGSAEARDAYLHQVCCDQPAMMRRVNGLLKHYAEGASFLEAPPGNLAPEQTTEQTTEQPGTLIGSYKLLEQIGEGGFGVVFMAEQTEPVRRKVALKVLKAGMDTRQVVARFEAERQALAIMDHPNIARVFDGGATATGRPFFVMELVRGAPITEYCDQNHLTPRERLELFATVCHSVQHAHQKGVIHRDLKPSNVLVSRHDTTPIVKIIDFGVAKALGQSLTDKTLFTGIAQMIGTPLYMSPEQAGMSDLDVDTRSDIYSLGVLLYELLTGTTPFDKDRLKSVTFDEMRRIIREEEPDTVSQRLARTRRGVGVSPAQSSRHTPCAVTPSSLATSHQPLATRLSELDWIVMKSLEKDRSRRYESASALAADIQRYLSDEPVLACPPTTMYRFQKFARKHKPALATAAAIAACLILGTTVSAWQAVRATQAEAQANTNEAQAKEAAASEAQQRQRAEANEQKANTQRDEAQRQRDEVRTLADRLQRTLYAAHMNLANNAWDASGVGRVRELLEQHRPKAGEMDLRGFEWHYLNRLTHTELLTITGAGADVAYSPDGKRLASGGKVWDAQTGKELHRLKGTIVFSPDGKRLASVAADKTVKVWNSDTGQEVLTFNTPVQVRRVVSFSPDGAHIATGDGGGENIKFWDAQTGRETHSLQFDTWCWTLAFSPDGKQLVRGFDDGSVAVLNSQTGEVIFKLGGHSGPVRCFAFSPDGKRLASATGTDRIGPPIPRRPGEVKVWDCETGQELHTLRGYRVGINGVAFSPDGKRLASASGDRTVRVWDCQTGQALFTLHGHTGMAWGVAFSPDGSRLASGSDGGTVKVWNAQPDRSTFTLKGNPTTVVASVAYSPDGGHLATAGQDGKVEVWDAAAGQKRLSFQAHDGIAWSVSYSADGRRLASAGLDGFVKMWDAQTGQELLSAKGREGAFTSVAVSPDGKRLASGSDDDTVKIWDAQTGTAIFSMPHAWASSVAFSPDGKRLATASGEVKLWDSETGREVQSLKGVAEFRGALAFSPDGQRLASPSRNNTVKVWDTKTGQELVTFKGHADNVSGVTFSPDGKRLASASMDQTVKLWDAETGQELLTLEGHSWYVNDVAFSPDGRRLACGGPDGTVKIYDATPLPEKP